VHKALVADTTSVLQFVLERILGKEGFELSYVRHVRDLLVQIKMIQPDLLFLEAEIHRGKGKQICEFLHRRPETRHLPIILTTRIPDPDRHSLSEWPGVHAVLRKPLNSTKVKKAVASIDFGTTADLIQLFRDSDAV